MQTLQTPAHVRHSRWAIFNAPKRPQLRAWIAVGAGLSAVAALGVWGLSADRSNELAVTQFQYDGGIVRAINAWTVDDPMAAMMGGTNDANQSGFAQQGMSMGAMSQMMSDAVPEGMKRVAVQIELLAGNDVMNFPADDVTLEIVGGEVLHYQALLGDEMLQPGELLSGVVTFEVPMDTMEGVFRLSEDSPGMLVDVSRGANGGEPATHDHAGD